MSPDSVIHDIGYQRYTGVRLGRGYAARSLYTHGLRTVFGLGRPAKAKIFPWAMIALMALVAVIALAVRAISGEVAITYLGYDNGMWIVFTLFLAATAPELVSRDLRNNVLPLYFSRPLSRSGYVWAKLAALTTGSFLIFAGPLTAMLLAGEFTVTTWHDRRHEFTDYLGGLGLAALYSIVFAALALLLASWLRRRMVAAAVIVGYILLTSAVGEVVGEILGSSSGKAIGAVFGPPTLVAGLGQWLYRFHGTAGAEHGPLFAIVTVLFTAACVGLLHLRYRKVIG